MAIVRFTSKQPASQAHQLPGMRCEASNHLVTQLFNQIHDLKASPALSSRYAAVPFSVKSSVR